METTRLPFPALLLVLASACTANAEPSASAASPVTACSGEYRCGYPDGGDFRAALHREPDGRCVMGSIEIGSDGKIRGESVDGTWTGDAQRFSMCVDGSCVTCEAPTPKSSAGACTGSPSSCSSRGPGSCSTIRGCRMATRVRYDGTYDNYCTGSPRACEDLDDESSCSDQGCDWK